MISDNYAIILEPIVLNLGPRCDGAKIFLPDGAELGVMRR